MAEEIHQWPNLSEVKTGGGRGICRLPLFHFFHHLFCRAKINVSNPLKYCKTGLNIGVNHLWRSIPKVFLESLKPSGILFPFLKFFLCFSYLLSMNCSVHNYPTHGLNIDVKYSWRWIPKFFLGILKDQRMFVCHS